MCVRVCGWVCECVELGSGSSDVASVARMACQFTLDYILTRATPWIRGVLYEQASEGSYISI